MIEFCVISCIVILIFIVWSWHRSYEIKVKEVKDFLLSHLSKFSSLIDLTCEVQTDNKKIKSWDKQHKIDYIIIKNKDKVLTSLILYNEFIIWWKSNKENIFKNTLLKANSIANTLTFFTETFKKKINLKIKKIFYTYNPNLIKFK